MDFEKPLLGFCNLTNKKVWVGFWPLILIYCNLGISFAIVLIQNLHLHKMKHFMETDVNIIMQIKSVLGIRIHAKMVENAGKDTINRH